MSFLQQLESEPPALTLEETLAFLDAFDYGSDGTSGDSSVSGSSPAFDYDFDDNDSGATTAAGSDSERSCTDADVFYLSTLLSLPPESNDAPPVTPPLCTTFNGDVPPTPPTKPVQRMKRKASATAISTAVSPKHALPTATDASTDAASGTKRRARKMPKTEILRLRDEVDELQARLTQLQKTPTTPGSAQPTSASTTVTTQLPLFAPSKRSTDVITTTTNPTGSWLDSAVAQFQALQKAEALNEKLKTEVSRQTRLGNALKSIFTKKTTQQGLDFVAEMAPPPASTAPVVSGGTSMCPYGGTWVPTQTGSSSTNSSDADVLYKSVERMQIETDDVARAIAAESDSNSVFSSSKTKFRPSDGGVFGPVFEFSTSTPVRHPRFHDIALMFWNRAITTPTVPLAPLTTSLASIDVGAGIATSQSMERAVSLRIHRSDGADDVVLNGISIMRRHDELDRTVFTFAATLVVVDVDASSTTNGAMVFREHGWMIVRPHESDDTQCVLQTFYRLDSAKRPLNNAQTEFSPVLTDAEVQLRDVGMNALSENMRSFQTEVQSALLNQGRPLDSSALPRICPFDKMKQGMMVKFG